MCLMSIFQTPLSDRAVLQVSGPERFAFLQNLVTQNTANLPAGACVMAALLTPQGKLLHEFLLFAEADAFYIDCDASQAEALFKKLSLYKLRAEVSLSQTDLRVMALWQEDGFACPPTANFVQDPRHEGLGLRALVETQSTSALPSASLEAWHANRIRLGVAQGAGEMPPGTVFPLDFGLAQMHGVDFQKGCFIGQEVTSRIQRKGRLKKKIHAVGFAQSAPARGSEITAGTRACGEIIAAQGSHAIALIREDARDQALTCDGQNLTLMGGVFEDLETPAADE
jgi:folate-binding protein YgfZ